MHYLLVPVKIKKSKLLWGNDMEELDIGKKLQKFRGMRGMSIRELSQCSGVTPSMLSQMERGLVNPSINTLKQIAHSLDVPMFLFFKEDDNKELVVHKGMRKVIGHPEEKDTVYELLTPDVSGMIEFCLMEIPPESESGTAAQKHNGEEVAYVLEGTVEIQIDAVTYSLIEGDSIRIPAMNFHKWMNRTEKPVKVIFAVTPPSF